MSPELVAFWQAQGPWALLFVSLLLLYIKQSKQREEAGAKREERLIAVIESLNDNYDKLARDVETVKKIVERRAVNRNVGGN